MGEDEGDDGRCLYRKKHGWSGSDLIHDKNSPVRVIDYFVMYGSTNEMVENTNNSRTTKLGGVNTQLTGVVHFTTRAESHAGFCHGGSMTSVMDDVIGWSAFLTTGSCKPWSGYTVQVNTNLKKPIPVDSILLVQGVIRKVDGRKVTVMATISDPANGDIIHSSADGLVILNRGVLSES